MLADDLGKHGPGALPHGRRAGGDLDHSRESDANAHLLVRPAAGCFDEVGKADAEVAAGRTRLALPPREIVPARPRQRLDLTGGIVAGIENDRHAAAKMHFTVIEWDAKAQTSTASFLAWVKENVVKGYPVAIGIYTNEHRFYKNPDRNAGDPNAEHELEALQADV